MQAQLSGHLPGGKAAAGDTVNRFSFERLRKDPTLHAHQTLLSSSEKLAWVSTETREDQVPLAQFVGQIAPRRAGARDPKDRVEHPAMIGGRAPALRAALKQKRRKKNAHSSSVISSRSTAALPKEQP